MVSKKNIYIFFLLFLIGKNKHGIGKIGGNFRLGKGPKFGPYRRAENPLASEKQNYSFCNHVYLLQLKNIHQRIILVHTYLPRTLVKSA